MSQNLTLYFPRSSGLVFMNSVLETTLQTASTAVTRISCGLFYFLFCWTDRDHQSSILCIRVFRVYVNAGLCTFISGAPSWLQLGSELCLRERHQRYSMRAIGWLGNLACSFSWLSLTHSILTFHLPLFMLLQPGPCKQLQPDL